MQVSEIMHKGVNIVQINDSLQHVAKMMKDRDLGSLPVYKDLRPVGFVTDRDIVVSCVSKGTTPDQPVSLAMKPDIVWIEEDKNVREAAEIMKQKQISRLLVVDKGSNPVGMLSLQDITEDSVRDRIKTEVIEEIKRQ